MTQSSSPPGIPSPARLAGWLNDHVPGRLVELTDIQLIAGGRSNLTYRLTVSTPGAGSDGPRLLVLRRPPLGHVLPTAHDMSREFRVLSALAGTKVPVAPLVAACTDTEVLGAPFYVMEYVPGVVLRTHNDTKDLTEAQAADLSRCLAEMLAAIHGVDVNQVGLGDLGRGAGYLRRQLARWQRQWELSVTENRPGYIQLVERLTAALPAETESQTTLVHGDYRLDNALVTLDPQPRIAAVVDWEMATLGDPLADLGLTLV
ncbi:MAG: phosphotransferase family protein, partial [Streptosporangiaceae bacterium]